MSIEERKRSSADLRAAFRRADPAARLALGLSDTRCLLAVIWLCDQSPTGCTTYREIADKLSVNINVVRICLRRLRKAGFVAPADPGSLGRTIRPLVRLEMTEEAFSCR